MDLKLINHTLQNYMRLAVSTGMLQISVVFDRMRILDDDIDAKALIPREAGVKPDSDEDETPYVAEFVDERPVEIQELEKFRQNKCWKTVGCVGGM